MDLLLQHNETALWHLLVQEAQKNRHIYLAESLEIYLAELLKRFSERPEMTGSVLGLEFLEAQEPWAFRDLGDKCLLFAGLFPGRAERKRINIHYFIQLGQEAYTTVAQQQSNEQAALFENLGREFMNLREVLAATRPQQDLLQTIGLWEESKSPQVYQGIIQQCNSTVLIAPGTQRH